MTSSLTVRLLHRIVRNYYEQIHSNAVACFSPYAGTSGQCTGQTPPVHQPCTVLDINGPNSASLAEAHSFAEHRSYCQSPHPPAAQCSREQAICQIHGQATSQQPGLHAQQGRCQPTCAALPQPVPLPRAALFHSTGCSAGSWPLQPIPCLHHQRQFSSFNSSHSSRFLGRKRHRPTSRRPDLSHHKHNSSNSSNRSSSSLDQIEGLSWPELLDRQVSSTTSSSSSRKIRLDSLWQDWQTHSQAGSHLPLSYDSSSSSSSYQGDKQALDQHAYDHTGYKSARQYRSSSRVSFASRWFSSYGSSSRGLDIGASCDVPLDHPQHGREPAAAAGGRSRWRDRSSMSGGSSSSSRAAHDNWRPWSFAKQIQGGNVDPKTFQDPRQILTSFYTEGTHGGLGRRFRRKVPLFEVIEYHANGTAVEQYKPRTPQQLGLHPRDVVLFAPLSRLAAPQRATIVVHDGKILVKTEIVKAIITAEKAILIKGRRDADTQKLSQNILAANDQRLMAINMHLQQLQQQEDARASQSVASLGCGKAPSAAEVIRTSMFASRLNAGHGIITPAWDSEDGAMPRGGGELKDVPFEMLVLEVLLDATTEYFYTKVQHLNWMLESIAADIRQGGQPQGAMDKAHQLIPIQKFLTSVKNDVKETSAAVKQALECNETLQDLCLSWNLQQQQQQRISSEMAKRRRLIEEGFDPDDDTSEEHYSMIYGQGYRTGREQKTSVGPGHQVRMLTEMLESYEREIHSLEGSINEAEEDLDNTRALWHMQLDSSRNHIIMVNLWLSMLNISVMASTILPAFFGMNLEGPISSTDGHNFFLVCGGSIALAALSYPASRFWYTHNWRKINQNRIFEHKMLRVLLVQQIEDLDSIIHAVKRVRWEYCDRHMFRQLLLDALGNRAMTPAHMDFLFQCYDRDRDGFIEEAQMIRPLNTYHTPIDTGATSNGSSSSSSHRHRTDLKHHNGSSMDGSSNGAGSDAAPPPPPPPPGGYFEQIDQAHEEKLQNWESQIASETTGSSGQQASPSSSDSSSSSSDDSDSDSSSSDDDSQTSLTADGGSRSTSAASSSSSGGAGSIPSSVVSSVAKLGSLQESDAAKADSGDDSDGDFRVERGGSRSAHRHSQRLNPAEGNRWDDESADYQMDDWERGSSDSDSDDESSGGRGGETWDDWTDRRGGRQQSKGGDGKPRRYPGSWMDDPRFNWD